MQSKVKLSKRQIKEDKFTTFVLTSKQQLSENWQFLVIGVVIVALAIFAVGYYFDSRSSWKVEGSDMFARAMMEYRSGDRQVAITTFEQILADYGSHTVAEESRFLLGSINFELRNYPEATRYWEEFLAKHKGNQLKRAAALAGVASCLENQGDNAAAATKYTEAVQEFPAGPLSAQYHAGAMRNFLLAGDIESARQQLDELKALVGQDTDLYRRSARSFAEKAYAG